MDKNEKLEYLNIDTSLYQTRISSKFKNRKPYSPSDPRIIISFIPGTIVEIFTKEGEIVKKGDILMIVDAMKMQNRLICSTDGRVKTISVRKGDKVSKGTILAELE